MVEQIGLQGIVDNSQFVKGINGMINATKKMEGEISDLQRKQEGWSNEEKQNNRFFQK